ncbi:FAD synthase [Thiovulum sp. ES]|nr:FAD synthase [Thiovulum sp. ES]
MLLNSHFNYWKRRSEILHINSLAIGKFDGLHLGHRELFSKLSKNGGVLIIDKKREKYLLPPKYRENFLEFPIFFYKFEDIFHLSGGEFLEKLISDFPNLEHIVVGYDFRFGENRTSSANDLHKLFDGKISIVDEVKIDNISVHSKEIANRLENGEIEKANLLLGRNYSIFAKHFRERGLGSQEIFPTLNLQNRNFLFPKSGVYKTETKIKKEVLESITFIGNRESSDNKFSFETHVLDRDLENRNFGEIETQFLSFIRENRKFGNLSELKKQIQKDIDFVKN